MSTDNEPSVAELVEWLKSYSANVDGHGSDCVRHAVVALTRLERRCAEMEKDRKAMAQRIARDLFEIGSEPGDAAQRIEFKGGTYPDKETALGGLSEWAMAVFLEAAPRKHALPPERANEGTKP